MLSSICNYVSKAVSFAKALGSVQVSVEGNKVKVSAGKVSASVEKTFGALSIVALGSALKVAGLSSGGGALFAAGSLLAIYSMYSEEQAKSKRLAERRLDGLF